MIPACWCGFTEKLRQLNSNVCAILSYGYVSIFTYRLITITYKLLQDANSSLTGLVRPADVALLQHNNPTYAVLSVHHRVCHFRDVCIIFDIVSGYSCIDVMPGPSVVISDGQQGPHPTASRNELVRRERPPSVDPDLPSPRPRQRPGRACHGRRTAHTPGTREWR